MTTKAYAKLGDINLADDVAINPTHVDLALRLVETDRYDGPNFVSNVIRPHDWHRHNPPSYQVRIVAANQTDPSAADITVEHTFANRTSVRIAGLERNTEYEVTATLVAGPRGDGPPPNWPEAERRFTITTPQ